MDEALSVWTAALGSGAWLTHSACAALEATRPHPPHDAAMQGAPWDDTLAWELHEWAFDSTAMVRARFASCGRKCRVRHA